jgi:galactosylceramidase
MHDPWHEEYGIGYEYWLMTEAKKRNPNIKLYGLAWGYPQWVSCNPGTLTNCSDSPYTYPVQTATYVSKWILGALNTYNLTIDYIGIWNERPYDVTYIKTLRNVLNSNGLQHVSIVAPDSNWDIAADILADPELAAAVSVIGAHYPGTTSSSQAKQTDHPLWASEDDSTFKYVHTHTQTHTQ